MLYRSRTAYPLRLGENEAFHRVVLAFAARLALGLYYETTQRIVPAGWWVVASWHTNHMLDQDEHLEGLLKLIGAPRTLTMGKHSVAQEFRYWGGAAVDAPDRFMVFAAFREAFGVLAIVSPPDDEHGEHPAVFRPGFLKGFAP